MGNGNFRRVLAAVVLWLVALPWSVTLADEPYSHVKTKETFNYLLRLPDAYAGSERKFPLLVFLHGVGEMGSGSAKSIEKVARHGPFRSMREGNWDPSLPLIVAGPQVGGLKWWWPIDKVSKFVQYLVENYRIDRNRIYVTGVSMGGRGVWDLAEKYPQRAAAMIPAGAWAADLKKDCASMRDIGVWAFHGTEDGLIKFRDGVEPIETLRNCNPSPRYNPVLTPLQGAEHGSWELVYDNRHGGRQIGADGQEYDNIYRWLLTFSRDIDPSEQLEK
jgi:predicted peptidase